MDPTRPDNNQQPVPTPVVGVGTKEAPIVVDTSSPIPTERSAGIEPSYPEVHETLGGFIMPNPSAQPPIGEIQIQLNELGVQPVSAASHLNFTPTQVKQLREGPVESGGTWLGTLVGKSGIYLGRKSNK